MSFKTKEKAKRKKKKKKKKKEKRIEKPRHFALKLEHGPRGIWRKPLKPGALRQLVGSHRLSSLHGWMGGVWQVVGAGVSKSFGV